MRKRTKSRVGKNAHRCMCKPNKTGHSCRWSDRELLLLKEFEKEKNENT